MQYHRWKLVLSILLVACAHTATVAQVQPTTHSQTERRPEVERLPVLVGTFDNSIFAAQGMTRHEDFLVEEAQSMLVKHLEATGRISVQEKARLPGHEEPAPTLKPGQVARTANTLISGDIATWKVTGAASTKPFMRVEVVLYVFTDLTQDAPFFCQGKGQFELSATERRSLKAGRLNDQGVGQKALDLAILDAVKKLIQGLDRGAWRPATNQSNTPGFSPHS